MQCESPLHRGERFAIEAQLLAKSRDGVRYDVATFAEHLLDDDEGGEVPPFRPCLILRRDSPDFRWLQRWTAVGETWAASEHPWISDIRDIAETDVGPDLQSRQPPLAAIPRPRRPIDPNPAIPPVGRMDARIVCNGVTASVGRRACFRDSAAKLPGNRLQFCDDRADARSQRR
jgi:hypothetical protein